MQQVPQQLCHLTSLFVTERVKVIVVFEVPILHATCPFLCVQIQALGMSGIYAISSLLYSSAHRLFKSVYMAENLHAYPVLKESVEGTQLPCFSPSLIYVSFSLRAHKDHSHFTAK